MPRYFTDPPHVHLALSGARGTKHRARRSSRPREERRDCAPFQLDAHNQRQQLTGKSGSQPSKTATFFTHVEFPARDGGPPCARSSPNSVYLLRS
jgi:hypothetical protein